MGGGWWVLDGWMGDGDDGVQYSTDSVGVGWVELGSKTDGCMDCPNCQCPALVPPTTRRAL